MFELPYLVSGGSSAEHYLRGIYESHSYQFASCSGSLTGIEQKTPTTELLPEDYETVDWSSCNVRGKGLYVLGPVDGGTPLTVSISSFHQTVRFPTALRAFRTLRLLTEPKPIISVM